MKSMALDAIPVVGGIKAAEEVIVGEDYFTKQKIPNWAKGLMITGGLLGAGGITKMVLKRFGKTAPKVARALDDIGKVDTLYDQTLKEMRDLKKVTPTDIGHELRRQFVDVSGNLKAKLLKTGNEGKRVVMRHDLIAGASTKAMKEYDEVSELIKP